MNHEEHKVVSLINNDDSNENTTETPLQPVKRDRKGIYLLPNLFTTGALFSGFYAVVAGMNGHFENAAIAIFVAMILDGLDGRVARLTNTQSDFGAEYDSLADMVSFGVAPALVAFSWALQDLGKVGWVAAFVYCAGAALRLARFNTQLAVADKNFFTGLASPAAAAIVAGTVWVFSESGMPGREIAWLMAVVVPTAGLLMVSNFRYHSFKGLDLRGKVPFVAMLAVVFVFVIVSIDPAKVLLGVFVVYALSGPCYEGWTKLKERRNS
ncbi:MAG: CDP-diacylglycerol--serine O-phosphatidyltransferase [Thalassolituus sp.]|jgi:CDP-diacylglycerol--serine O-phosphatidyltransferase|uniref:CDP-diacylglycerol--serine O-phosphatidyltransferase n=2 Tax=root TaxID=1 RepID=M5DWI9_9GAMM|nr:CDP-diacylglycerol--serine O-phosphatidyltransferase [Thalassolituus oleivorans]PHQ86978.1 MAG: CDP-diacylglycerol--serine O-phosphatidyltransferase [Thalassobium sp.]AHK16814.1 CDP-diacylglycerol--serine O-phosphatidyltransferase [Thalassolituus oleivorans R6-15]MBQ0726822.1 CDP-diacylglycerol--serine O-phosphatidyltransferase [Thalassolituus oleivorans]MBQ0779934.1 CDP-diacylglycerol--serine O-phosphatidyltransferase [Thalassolituus oleivorans]MCA6128426.1 CDP-diacylglycerol--serine O-pho